MSLKRILLSIFLLLGSACTSTKTAYVHKQEDGMLKGMRIAILVTDGFEQVELTEPRKALEEAGAQVLIVSPKSGTVQGYNHDNKGDKINVDILLNRAKSEDFHALLLPGGVKNPDSLRLEKDAISFIKNFGQQDKPIAAICHGPWTLIDAGLVKGHKVTSWPSLAQDLKNAGADWVDEEVVVSKNLVTSRKPQDIPAFNRAMIETFAKHHQRNRH